MKEGKRLFFVIMIILSLSILGNHEAWWARFVPQLWSLPLFIVLFLSFNWQINTKKLAFIYLFLFICLINSSIINYQYLQDRVALAQQRSEWINAIVSQGGQMVVTKDEQKNLPPTMETLPIKLEEYGIKVYFE